MVDIPFSQKYHHDVKVLYREHAEKRITDEELSQRLDELREREAKSQEAMGPLLILQKLGATEKEIEAEVQQELLQEREETKREERAQQLEKDRQLQKQLREQQTEEVKVRQKQEKRGRAREHFRGQIDTYINRLEGNAQNLQRWYTWLQVLLLVFSALTAAMASIEWIPRGVVSFVGVIATVAGGLLTTFKVQERIYASRKAIAEVRLECQKYDYHIDEYKDLSTDEESFIKFSRSISLIQGQEMLQEVELWNPKKEEQKEEKQKTQEDQGTNENPKETSEDGKQVERQDGEEQSQKTVLPVSEGERGLREELPPGSLSL